LHYLKNLKNRAKGQRSILMMKQMPKPSVEKVLTCTILTIVDTGSRLAQANGSVSKNNLNKMDSRCVSISRAHALQV
jgi:hypothetical protein